MAASQDDSVPSPSMGSTNSCFHKACGSSVRERSDWLNSIQELEHFQARYQQLCRPSGDSRKST